MTAIDHVWGRSAGADRVWSQVSGLPAKRGARRLLVVWQAFIDESFDEDAFVLAGWVASAESWAAFSEEWEGLLPLAYKNKDDKHQFKMKDMAKIPERMENAQAFFRVIERHVAARLSFAIRPADFVNAVGRIIVLDIDGTWHGILRPQERQNYFWAFSRLMSQFHILRDDPEIGKVIPSEEKVDFYFDNRDEKKVILSSWDSFLAETAKPELYGATPRFEDDEDFLPLQAADFIAWWIREWINAGIPDDEIHNGPYPWPINRAHLCIHLAMNEDEIADRLLQQIREEYPHSSVMDRNRMSPIFRDFFDPQREKPADS